MNLAARASAQKDPPQTARSLAQHSFEFRHIVSGTN